MSVAFVREESAAAAQEVRLPPRAISAQPNLVTQSGLRALERALADSQQALKAAQALLDADERRRALELAARDAMQRSEILFHRFGGRWREIAGDAVEFAAIAGGNHHGFFENSTVPQFVGCLQGLLR